MSDLEFFIGLEDRLFFPTEVLCVRNNGLGHQDVWVAGKYGWSLTSIDSETLSRDYRRVSVANLIEGLWDNKLELEKRVGELEGIIHNELSALEQEGEDDEAKPHPYAFYTKETSLEEIWNWLQSNLGINLRYYSAWLGCYRHRGYHNEHHIKECLDALLDPVFPFDSQDEFNDVVIALFMHDIVCEAGSKSNEYLSAMLAEDWFKGLDSQRIQSIKVMILSTDDNHKNPRRLGNIVRDCDRSILSSDWGRYRAYANGIYKEYSAVCSMSDYYSGRSQFLNELLLNDVYIYLDEGDAKNNIVRELKHLSNGLLP